ncbi:MAG: hypothetical protein IKR31_06700 [Prevotella sp.]|nr:hypothetical protein [Prevotella sp.]
MEEWKEYKLGDIAQVKGGKRLPKGVNLQIFCIFWCIDSITVNEVEKEIR